jgi:hypothetical protein
MGGIKIERAVSWLTRFKIISARPSQEFYGAANLDDAAFQAAHVANIFEIRRENNQRERTRRLLFAEADEVDSFCSGLHVQDFTVMHLVSPTCWAAGEWRGSRRLIAACRVGWPVRLHAEPGCERPGSPYDFAQPSRGRLSPALSQ